MITICCKCKKTKSKKGLWSYRAVPADVLISHAYCPQCYVQVMKEIAIFEARQRVEAA